MQMAHYHSSWGKAYAALSLALRPVAQFEPAMKFSVKQTCLILANSPDRGRQTGELLMSTIWCLDVIIYSHFGSNMLLFSHLRLTP